MVRYLVAGSTATFLISFTSLVLIARLFPLPFIADAKAVTVYGGWFSVVFTCQVQAAYLFFHRENSVGKTSVRGFTLAFLLLAGVASGLAFFYVFPLLYEAAGLTAHGRLAFSGVVALNLLFGVSPSLYTAEGLGRRLPRLMLAYPAASLASLLIAWRYQFDVNSYGMCVLVLAAAVIATSEWRRYVPFAAGQLTSFWRKYDRRYGSYAARIFASNFVEALSDRLDKVFVSRFIGAAVFARYSVVCFENPLVPVLLSSYGLSLVKRFQGGVAGREENFFHEWEKMVRVISFITFPMSLFLLWHSDWFITTVFGTRFLPASAVLKVYLLVSLFRYAPFQALLRLEGAVQFNVIMALGFLGAATTVGVAILLSGAPWELMALSYLAGWVVFNLLAIQFFHRVSGIPRKRVVLPRVWLERVAECGIAATLGAAIAHGNVYIALAASSLLYLALVMTFDPTMRTLAFRTAADVWRHAVAPKYGTSETR